MLVGRWVCWLDVEAGRSAYDSWTDGGLGDCHCAACDNLRTLDDKALPHEGQSILTALGVDVRKPFGIVHHRRNDDGKILCEATYFLRGGIVAQRIHPSTEADQGGEYVTAEFSLECQPVPDHRPDAFASGDWIALVVRSWTRWVVDEDFDPGAHSVSS